VTASERTGCGRFIARLLFVWPLLTGAAEVAAADVAGGMSLLERRVKAALLFRFIHYVEWPEAAFAGPAAPFLIAIAGDDVVAAELAEFAAGRKLGSRPLQVRRSSGAASLKEAQLVFVAQRDAQQFTALAKAAPPLALLVTEWPNALQQGSVVNFVLVEGQVRFEVSLEAAQRRQLRLSSRLLSVAHDVHPGTP
jgi:hypothetical protein